MIFQDPGNMVFRAVIGSVSDGFSIIFIFDES